MKSVKRSPLPCSVAASMVKELVEQVRLYRGTDAIDAIEGWVIDNINCYILFN